MRSTSSLRPPRCRDARRRVDRRRAGRVGSSGGCDIAVVVRGGGSKADLAAFDAEPVARAIATMPIPVWVGIGHTGDQSVADIVANRSFVTPTECGQELVGRVGSWWDSVTDGRRPSSRRAHEALDDSAKRDDATRRRLVSLRAPAAAAPRGEPVDTCGPDRPDRSPTGRGVCSPSLTPSCASRSARARRPRPAG